MRPTLSIGAFAALALAVMTGAAGAQMTSRVSFASPSAGSTVAGPAVDVKLTFENFKTVAAGSPVKAGEGHAHIFIDRKPMATGEVIPADQPNIVHLGKAPFDSRSIELDPGSHTLYVLLGDSAHKALDVPAASVTFTVGSASAPRPNKAPAAGDGSLADNGFAARRAVPAALAVLVVLAAVTMMIRRRRVSAR